MDNITCKWDRLSLNQRESQTVPLTSDVTGDGKDEQQYEAWLRASTERNQKSHAQSSPSSNPT